MKKMLRWPVVFGALFSMTACGSSVTGTLDDAGALSDGGVLFDAAVDGSSDSASDTDATSVPLPAPISLRKCATSGRGAIIGDVCYVVTPAEAGLPAGGSGAGEDQYALRPSANPRGKLLVFLNGSGGSPRGAVASADKNFYVSGRDAGLHVLGLSYRSDKAIGQLCAGSDSCFEPARETILKGEFQGGAPADLQGIAADEGVYARLYAALRILAASDANGGWSDYLTPGAGAESSIVWSKILVSGHSQGGGHAALIGRDHAVDRVVMLSSPCDATRNDVPASWLTKSVNYKTDPASNYQALGAPGDAICPAYAAAWLALGMPSGARRADATVCSGSAAHGATLACTENAATWGAMLR
jgi:hypothetical protein